MAPIPNELSSSSMAEPSKPNFVPNCGTLLLSFPKLAPFLKASPPPPPSPTSSSSRKLNFTPPDIFAIAQNLHTSILSAAHQSLRNLQSFASQNPLLNRLLSLNSFHQIRDGRNYCRANSISSHNFAAVLPGDSVAGLVVANGLSNFLNLYNTVLIVRLVLTWFPNAPPAIVSPLSTICDPYLNIFRGIIPPLGGTLDLSPILAFLVLNAFTSSAAALPAELPPTELPNQESSSSPTRFSHVTTTSHKKWLRRVQGHGSGIRTKTSSDSH